MNILNAILNCVRGPRCPNCGERLYGGNCWVCLHGIKTAPLDVPHLSVTVSAADLAAGDVQLFDWPDLTPFGGTRVRGAADVSVLTGRTIGHPWINVFSLAEGGRPYHLRLSRLDRHLPAGRPVTTASLHPHGSCRSLEMPCRNCRTIAYCRAGNMIDWPAGVPEDVENGDFAAGDVKALALHLLTVAKAQEAFAAAAAQVNATLEELREAGAAYRVVVSKLPAGNR